MKTTLLLAASLALAGLLAVAPGVVDARGGRISFTLPPTTSGPTQAISCDSVLVKANPSAYPQCCFLGQWKFVREENSNGCPSGRQYVLERDTCPGEPGSKTVCEPTTVEKAQNFIDALALGNLQGGGAAPAPPVAKPINNLVTPGGNATDGRRKRGLSVPCPSSDAEKRVCQDILSGSCRGKRSLEEEAGEQDRENALLADLIHSQEDMYLNKRRKRSDLPAIERNVYFVVDSSGSIGYSTYQRVLNVLATFSTLFCGDASIGLVSYATSIDLEFCPTCLRNLDESQYRTEIAAKIQASRYHAGWTNTGETVKCLSEELLPSPDCRDTTKPTQLVFFTDGRANGCTDPPDALAALTARYPTLETYAIGMGNIAQSGITDLLSNAFDPNNVFNVNTITELEDLLTQIQALIQGNSLECSPVTFG